jgi:predicted  nucleic acid-binding Zn-ribbon protein
MAINNGSVTTKYWTIKDLCSEIGKIKDALKNIQKSTTKLNDRVVPIVEDYPKIKKVISRTSSKLGQLNSRSPSVSSRSNQSYQSVPRRER